MQLFFVTNYKPRRNPTSDFMVKYGLNLRLVLCQYGLTVTYSSQP